MLTKQFTAISYTGCCIYEKPRKFGESSSESDTDKSADHGCTDHCHGHRKKCFTKKHHTGIILDEDKTCFTSGDGAVLNHRILLPNIMF